MVKRVSKRVSEIVFLIAAGGSTYYLIEIWFRGFSHWTMFVLGGVALTFCSFQGEVMHWSEPMWIQIIRAVLFLTSLEFMTGIICNKWLKIGIWDYRDQPFQLCGQICLPFIKYTPTWPRSFMPTTQSQRNLIARMKLIPVHSLIEDRSLLLIDDSIVRGTQLRETTEFLYQSGAKEVHVRPACPPLLYGCKYLNFSRSKSDLDLITRRIIREWEGDNDVNVLSEYADPNSDRYAAMLEEIRKRQNFTSLRYHRLDDLIKSIGIDACQVCTYCFNGVE